MNLINYFKEITGGLKTLIQGMQITGGYFVRPKEIVTQKYPENRKELKMFDRFKGEVIMPHTDQNTHRCTGCGICETNCPNGSIEIITSKEVNAEGKSVRAIDKHIYHLSMCTFCGLCIKTCPSDALAWGQDFEHAMFNRVKLTKVLNQPGSKRSKEIKE